MRPTLAMVWGNADHHHSLAHRRCDGTAAACRVVRLCRSSDRAHGPTRSHLRNRRVYPIEFGNPFSRHPRSLPFRCESADRTLGVRDCGKPTTAITPGAQRVCALERHCGCAGDPGLRLSDWAALFHEATFRSGRRRHETVRFRRATIMVRDQGPFKLSHSWPRIAWGSMAVVLV